MRASAAAARGEGVPASRRVGFGAQPRLSTNREAPSEEGAHMRAPAATEWGGGAPA